MWGERESLTANDNDLISVSLKIIRAPSSGRGRRVKRGGVGFPECGSTVSRGQPPPLRGRDWLLLWIEKEWAGSVSSFRHPERSRGIFFVCRLLFSFVNPSA